MSQFQKAFEEVKALADKFHNNLQFYLPPVHREAEVRKYFIDKTNTIEGYHRQVRKVTKTEGAFTSDMALLKLMYVATRNIGERSGPCRCKTGASLSRS